jgi:hypothetical protein
MMRTVLAVIVGLVFGFMVMTYYRTGHLPF